jgi:lysophospholipase L1-like esterase
MRYLLLLFAFCSLLLPATSSRADDPRPFELLDGDRVVFIGNTFIERDQVYGYLETMLTARWPDRNITFRNLGWSGDTVWGEARARFGTAADGFKHLKEHVESIKPTVIFVGYGANESFEGEAGLSRFEVGLNSLLDMLASATRNVRIILLAPIPQWNAGTPRPDPAQHNADLRLYSNLIEKVSSEREYRFVDLFGLMQPPAQQALISRFTDNGVHLTEHGYWSLWKRARRDFGMHYGGHIKSVGECGNIQLETFLDSEVSEFTETPRGYRFEMKHPWLPDPQPHHDEDVKQPSNHLIMVRGLPPGSYRYRIHADGDEVEDIKFDVGQRVASEPLPFGHTPEDRQIKELRRAIIEKNRLYFHRWRPQNETYLFGFRKHEQGQNAAEVPKFDPLVEELEAKIAKLRVPVKHTYELIRQD